MIDAILPAAGRATRMRGLPKFLLPSGPGYLTLIEQHIASMLEHCEKVWIPTRPEQVVLLETIGISSDRVVVVPMSTSSMTETILRVAGISSATRFVMAMPDTSYSGEKPYEYLARSTAGMSLACWEIRPDQMGKLGQVKMESMPVGRILEAEDKNPICNFPHAWGAMSFDRRLLELADKSMATIGDILPKLLDRGFEVTGRVMEGEYFDCGTPEEYIKLLFSESST